MTALPVKSQPSMADVWAEHTAQEFVHRDVDATMATMTDDPHVISVPVAAGGRGRDGVRDFYSRYFVGKVPEDFLITPISRTADAHHIVDEMVISFTHDIEVPFMLPEIAPTGKRVEFALVGIIGFRDGKIDSEHLYWDQATVLVQLGLLAETGLPVVGAEQVDALMNPAAPLNPLQRASARRSA